MWINWTKNNTEHNLLFIIPLSHTFSYSSFTLYLFPHYKNLCTIRYGWINRAENTTEHFLWTSRGVRLHPLFFSITFRLFFRQYIMSVFINLFIYDQEHGVFFCTIFTIFVKTHVLFFSVSDSHVYTKIPKPISTYTHIYITPPNHTMLTLYHSHTQS